MPSRAAAERSLTHDVPPTLEMQGVFWICVGASRRWRGGGVVVSKTRPTRVREVLLEDRADAEVRDVRARDGARFALDDVDDSGRFFYSQTTRTDDAPFQVPADAAVRKKRLLVVLVGEDGPVWKSSLGRPTPSTRNYHAETDDITVIMSILNMKGAWSFESPAPMEVTTATRFTSYFFIAAITVAVPVYFERCVDGVEGNQGRRVVPSVSMVGPTSFVLPPSEMITPSTSPPSNTFSTSAALVTEPLYL